MKLYVILVALVALALPAMAQSHQSLGDVARRERAKHRPAATHVYDNDTLPTTGTINIAPERDPFDEGGATTDKQKAAAQPDANKKSADNWRRRIDDQKKEISQLERELDLLQREQKLRVTSAYYDVGARLRDPKQWSDEQRKSDEAISEKQKKLADARQKLDDMTESARKEGVPSSVVEDR
jgi:chromosome segregation ATPase